MPPPPSPSATGGSRATRRPGGRPSTPSGQAGSRPTPRSRRSWRASRTTHRQPPLVFAVTRLLGAPEEGRTAAGRTGCARTPTTVVAECSRRSLQTNEPLRCAALLPALSGIDGSARPARGRRERGAVPVPRPLLVPLPRRPRPRPGRRRLDGRAGVDGHRRSRRCGCRRWSGAPASTSLRSTRPTPEDRRFLSSLVWPGEEGRAARIEAALDIVAADPPLLVARRRDRCPACSSRWRRALRPARRSS